MSDYQVFDLLSTPLHDTQLIEASAGTGKTYTIAGLFQRLLLEGNYQVDQILVVTFTNAATAELKDRIRIRLVEFREMLTSDATISAADPVIEKLLRQLDPELAAKRLENAIRGFDEAAIYTIHGFCQRVLADRAFASAMLFETELCSDLNDLLQEIVEDFWRLNFYQASPLLVDYLLAEKFTPEKLLQTIKPYLGKPYLEIVPLIEPEAEQQAEEQLNAAFTAAKTLWQAHSSEIKNLLLAQLDQLKANTYKAEKMSEYFEQLEQLMAADQSDPVLYKKEKLYLFTQSKLNKTTKKNHHTPQHPFFTTFDQLWQCAETLADQYEIKLKLLQQNLLHYTEQELAQRKRRQQIMSYDDLLLNLHNALTGEKGDELAKELHQRYPAALIDEFQDTDPLQYAIFRKIYEGSSLPVFLVGDPKQAIYSFRGADIFAYLKAHQEATQHSTLNQNWRSQGSLVEAVNRLFQNRRSAFVLDEIDFYPVQAAKPEAELQIKNDPEQALWFWFMCGKDDKSLPKQEARKQCARWTAAEIARLLNAAAQGQATLAGKPLRGGDIAVLVRKHDEGLLVREALLDLGIACVQQTRASVFVSHEAQELYYVLRALAEPGREKLVRAALASSLLGYTASELHHLAEDDHAWEQLLEQFHSLHQAWLEQGFVRMFRAFLRTFQVPTRLLAWPDGERRLTNVLHLMELLQQASQEQRLGNEGLLVWLAARLDENDDDETRQLRLESDSELVQVLTVHKSKGLEYPIVFCPYLWDGNLTTSKNKTLSFHDPEQNYTATLDLGSAQLDQHRLIAEREELAENLRMVYVALTRAKQRCYVLWGKINHCESSALAWLLYPQINTGSLADFAQQIKNMPAIQMQQQLHQFADRNARAIYVTEPPSPRAYQPSIQSDSILAAREFPGPVRGQWQISSFSSLYHHSSSEQTDYDDSVWLEETPPKPAIATANIFDFPKGPRTGRCLHQIFEQLEFHGATTERINALVEQILPSYGYELEWSPVVTAMVKNTLTTPLNSKSLCLARLKSRQCLQELEFYYPLQRFETTALKRLLQEYQHLLSETFVQGLQDILASMELMPDRQYKLQGYMKGYIDLVFESDGRYYIVDYKSNWLGAQAEDYTAEKLAEPMGREGYILQYLIYTIALHRYLKLRLPKYSYRRHFGGVYYLFLRGLNPLNDNGVYYDCPAPAFMAALDNTLRVGAQST